MNTKFKKGTSGNPAGRPKGAVNRQMTALREATDKILPLVVEQALVGDFEAQKLILTFALPKQKAQAQAEAFILPEASYSQRLQVVLERVATGELSPTAGTEIANIIAMTAKLEELETLRAEINNKNEPSPKVESGMEALYRIINGVKKECEETSAE